MNPPHILMSRAGRASCGEALEALVRQGRVSVRTLPPDGEPLLDEAAMAPVSVAFYSRDLHNRPSPGGNETGKALFRAVKLAPDFRWMQLFFAGVNDIPVLEKMMTGGVQVTTAAGAAAQPIAHSILAAVLAISRGFLHHVDAQRRRAWEPLEDDLLPTPLPGQRATVVGLGPIGREAARLLRAFGLRVTGIRQRAGDVDECDRTLRYEDLARVLPETDWLIVACPLTDLTRGIVSRQALASLPAGARLVNIARGEVVDESALIEALQSRRLAAAYLDVFANEPLAADSPLWVMPNVLISAHTAGASSDYDSRVASIFMDNLQRFLDGQPLRNLAIRSG